MNAFTPCVLEQLESRKLMSASFLAGSTLLVLGDHGLANTISVDLVQTTNASGAPQTDVEAKITTTNRHGVTTTLDKMFDASKVKYVYIRGGMEADVITVGDNGTPFNINARIDALGGADTVTTHEAAGTKMLVFGGKGNDILTVGDGDNAVWGGAGNDFITAGNGTDTFGCIAGHNTVNAGSGHYTYHVRNLNMNNVHDTGTDTVIVVKHESDAPAGIPVTSTTGGLTAA